MDNQNLMDPPQVAADPPAMDFQNIMQPNQQVMEAPQLLPFIQPPPGALLNNPSPAQLQQYAAVSNQNNDQVSQAPPINAQPAIITTPQPGQVLNYGTLQQTPTNLQNAGNPVQNMAQQVTPNNQLPGPSHNQGAALQQPQIGQPLTSGANQLITQQMLAPGLAAALGVQASMTTETQPSISAANLALLQNQLQNLPGNAQILNGTNMAAYLAALADPRSTLGTGPTSNMGVMNGGILITQSGPQVIRNPIQNPVPQATEGMASVGSSGYIAPEVPGTRAYNLLAVQHMRRYHAVKADNSRMKQLVNMKNKLLEKGLVPPDPKYVINFMDLSRIPGWDSNVNKERLKNWSARWAEIFKQTLLLEIEAELVKVMAKRDLIIQDGQAGSTNFGLVAVVRSDLGI